MDPTTTPPDPGEPEIPPRFSFDAVTGIFHVEKKARLMLTVDDAHYYVRHAVIGFPADTLHSSPVFRLLLSADIRPYLGADLMMILYRDADADQGWSLFWRYRIHRDTKMWDSADEKIRFHVALKGVDAASPEELAAAGFATRQDAAIAAWDTVRWITQDAEDPEDEGEVSMINGGTDAFAAAVRQSKFSSMRVGPKAAVYPKADVGVDADVDEEDPS